MIYTGRRRTRIHLKARLREVRLMPLDEFGVVGVPVGVWALEGVYIGAKRSRCILWRPVFSGRVAESIQCSGGAVSLGPFNRDAILTLYQDQSSAYATTNFLVASALNSVVYEVVDTILAVGKNAKVETVVVCRSSCGKGMVEGTQFPRIVLVGRRAPYNP